ncbi:hypothetical protein DBR11_26305 [Pedobacter sp. HMWF019]|uniref:hypothetical protein n=1 Tax=Pedobacter sp. HMWF019 TaxID=2056856 RepID=UPI000D39610F|nr:hypothetical protein [Pedobacter sp. HMWF019]PTS92771.1 hypothetical protein DBR11_26305 [Pedobacter sp. HMWF019]
MKTINLLTAFVFICSVGHAQETLQTVTDRGNATTNSLQIGGSSVNANTTKLFIRNPMGKTLFIILGIFLLLSSCSINTGVIGKFSSNKGSNMTLYLIEIERKNGEREKVLQQRINQQEKAIEQLSQKSY